MVLIKQKTTSQSIHRKTLGPKKSRGSDAYRYTGSTTQFFGTVLQKFNKLTKFLPLKDKILILGKKTLALWDKTLTQLRKNSTLREKFAILATSSSKLWDKNGFHRRSFLTPWSKIVIHLQIFRHCGTKT